MVISNLTELKFFRVHSSNNSQIFFFSNGPAIWHGLPDMMLVRTGYGMTILALDATACALV